MQPTTTVAIAVSKSKPAQVFREQNQTGACPGVTRNARCSSEPSVMSELWAFIATRDSPNVTDHGAATIDFPLSKRPTSPLPCIGLFVA